MSARDEPRGGRAPAPRPEVAGLEPYVPGRPAGAEAGSLASNESAFGPSPRVAAAVAAAAARVHRYPDPLAGELVAALAAEHGVDPEAILVGNGSDELIYLLVLSYAAWGGAVVCADPPYRIDEVVARAMGAAVSRVPLVEWRHDLDAMARVPADVAFVCNPHNPTGTALPASAVASFADRAEARLVVADEAYVDFVDDPEATTVLQRAAASTNLVALRTFSKLFGLAGARVGYLVGPREVVATLRRVRPPFSVSALAQAAALAALADRDHRRRVREETIAARARMTELFRANGFEVVPSQANFVLVLTESAEVLAERLEGAGVRVRPGRTLGVPGAVRVSAPSPEGMALLERALSS